MEHKGETTAAHQGVCLQVCAATTHSPQAVRGIVPSFTADPLGTLTPATVQTQRATESNITE